MTYALREDWTAAEPRETPDGGTLVDRLNEQIREHPVGTALIGVGIAWMLLGPSRLAWLARAPVAAATTTAEAAGSAASAVASGLADAGTAVGRGVARAGSTVAATARHMAETVTSRTDGSTNAEHAAAVRDEDESGFDAVAHSAGKAGRTMRQFRDTVGSTAHDAGHSNGSTARTSVEQAKQIGNSVREQLAARFEQQPLLLGALGLAIGAGLAALFAPSRLERRVLGPSAGEMRERMDDLVDEATHRAEKVVRQVRNDAEALRGTAQETLEDVAQKAKRVAQSTRQSIGGGLN